MLGEHWRSESFKRGGVKNFMSKDSKMEEKTFTSLGNNFQSNQLNGLGSDEKVKHS